MPTENMWEEQDSAIYIDYGPYMVPDREYPMDKPSPLFDQLQWLAAAGFQQVDTYWSKADHALFGGIKGG